MGSRPNKRAKTTPEIAQHTVGGAASFSAQAIWDENVSQRKPKLFQSMPRTEEWNTAAWLEDFPHCLKKRVVSTSIQRKTL